MIFQKPKILAVYAFAIPLALILGILAASPDQLTFLLLAMLFFFLALPVFINWHHAMLIVFWNSAFCAFFLPGQPPFWMFFAALSFGISLLGHILGRRPFLSAPEMAGPLIFLTLLIIGTACVRGGIGLKALGAGSHGGRYYVYMLVAIMGYLAFIGGRIPIAKTGKMTSLFFLSGATAALSNIAYALGPGFYILYNFVPAGLAYSQAASDFGVTDIDRLMGLAPACSAGLLFLLARYGIRGLFQYSKPWRLLFLLAVFAAGFFSGFRSVLIGLLLLLAVQFCLEGLLRTRFFPIMTAATLFAGIVLVLFSNKMPLSVQRTMSFLPLNVDASVRSDAIGTEDWRFDMWSVVARQIPKYFWVGKGYGFDGTEMELTQDAVRQGVLQNFETSILAGDYHSGPLSIIIPFGVGGVIAFVWLMIAEGRVLYRNYRYGDQRLRRINTVLFAYYISSLISFIFIFGAFNTQLMVFLGIVGLSISLNGGVRRASDAETEQVEAASPHSYAMELN